MFTKQQQNKAYLLSPVSLVPNGRAHLGHIAGPLLKIDILARHLKRRGDSVIVASTSDVYESHILIKAIQEQRTPEEVCNDYFSKISHDLRALDIIYDEYVNPLDPRWRDRYNHYNLQAMADLVANGATATVRERIPYSQNGTRAIVGGWLLGRCPACSAEAGSYFCEQCGAHFQPQDMVQPAPRFTEDAPLEWREELCLYLKLENSSDLFAQMEKMALRPDFQAIARRYLASKGPSIRLTNPGTWGIPWSVPGSSTPQVMFTYAALLYAANLICGEIFGERLGRAGNAFDPDSGVTTITCFGIDNAVPFLVGVLGTAMRQQRFKPFDHYLVNYFYNLEGSKFSTNRGHVIWAADLVERTPVTSDMMRSYLTMVNPEFETKNFDIADFIAWNNRVVQHLGSSLHTSLQARDASITESAPALIARLEELLAEQEAALDPATFHLHKAGQSLQTWLSEKDALIQNAHDHAWWIKGTALLCYPIMPRLGKQLWQSCGHDGEPQLTTFLEMRQPRPLHESLHLGQELNMNDLRPCLPKTLQ